MKKSLKLKQFSRAFNGITILFLVLRYSIVLADSGWSPFEIITDIDDTIRITNVLSYYDLIRRGIVGSDVFLGMQELYEELGKSTKGITYLSGSPHWIEKSVKRFLIEKKRFPMGEFRLSNWWNWESTEFFKTKAMIEIAQKKDSPFVIVGDDTQYDPEVFSKFRMAQPERVLNVYIHRIQDRVLPPEVKAHVIPYLTAFEVALNEFEGGRLQEGQVVRVAESILNTPSLDLLFPYFKVCPVDYSINIGGLARKQNTLVDLSNAMQERIRTYCVNRASTFSTESIELSNEMIPEYE